MPFHPFFGEGSPAKIVEKKQVGTLVLTSLLEGLGVSPVRARSQRLLLAPGASQRLETGGSGSWAARGRGTTPRCWSSCCR